MADRLASDSDMRDRRVVERLDDVVKMQNQWEMFDKKWENKIVQLQPRSKEGTITMAVHPIQKNVQAELEMLCTDRMENEDKIMKNKHETLNSQVEGLSQQIVNLKERIRGSAASTVAASSGSGMNTSNFAAHVMPSAFTPTRVELEG